VRPSALLAAGLLVGAAAVVGGVAGTVDARDQGTVRVDRPPLTAGAYPDDQWAIVVGDVATGATRGVYAGPGSGPSVQQGTGFTENYLLQLRRVESSRGLILQSSVISGGARVESTVTPVGTPNTAALLGICAVSLLTAGVLALSGRTGRGSGRLAVATAAGIAATAAGSLLAGAPMTAEPAALGGAALLVVLAVAVART